MNVTACPNGPDENGNWACDPCIYVDGSNIATCNVCGFEAQWPGLIDGREGMLTVYDSDGEYRGCIGAASWDVLLAEGDAAFEAGGKEWE